jgi:virulence-associated protein VagC
MVATSHSLISGGESIGTDKQGQKIIVEPSSETWDWLDAIAGTLDQDFLDAVLEQPDATERPELDELFSF